MSKKSKTFFLMYRGWMDNPIFKKEPFTEREAWAWMIENAVYLDKHEVRSPVTGMPVLLKMGQLYYAQEYMANAWGWSKKRVQRFLKRLEKCLMIVLQVVQGMSVVSICNYSIYQRRDPEGIPEVDPEVDPEGVPEGVPNKKQRINKDKKYTDGFEKLWKDYRNRTNDGKSTAFAKYKLSLKAGFSEQEIYDRCMNYNRSVDDYNYVKALTTLLTGHKFQDYKTDPREKQQTTVVPIKDIPPPVFRRYE